MRSSYVAWALFWVLFLLFLAPPRIGTSFERQDTHENLFFNLNSVAESRQPPGWVDPRPFAPPPMSVAIRIVCAIGMILMVLRYRRVVAAEITRFFVARDSAVNLALFRIVVFATMFYEVIRRPAVRQYPHELLLDARSWWMPEAIRKPDVFVVMKIVLLVACVLALVGWAARLWAGLAVLLALYVLGNSQVAYDRSFMTTHHLLWFGALLAASPCADVLSIDCLRRGRAGTFRGRLMPRLEPAVAYGMPLRMAWFLIGIIYFFPGVWKLWVAGWDWTLPQNFADILHFYWSVHRHLPLLRVDEYPLILRLLAVWTIIFELSFIFCIFSRRLRPWCALEAIGFLLGVAVVMGVHFSIGLSLCHLSFFDFSPLYARFASGEGGARGAAATWPCAAVGLFLIAVNTLCGVLKVQGWPFTTYPSFAGILGPTRPEMLMILRHADGSEVLVRPRHDTLNLFGLRARILRMWDDLDVHRRTVVVNWLFAFYDAHVRPTDTLRCYCDWQWTRPPWDESTLKAPELLIELPASALNSREPEAALDDTD